MPDVASALPRLVYHRRYDVTFFGLEALHPFDSRKYGRAWRRITDAIDVSAREVCPEREASTDELLTVHSRAYLATLRKPRVLAMALEIPVAMMLPARLTDWRVLAPMRRAVHGSVLAAREALDHGLAFNLAGGYHHAKPETGEGFCVYADAVIAVAAMRAQGRLGDDARVLYVDVDAHMGNGVATCVADDQRWTLVDLYNGFIYPDDPAAAARIDVGRPLRPGTGDTEYLAKLRDALDAGIERCGEPALAIVNAGTDVLVGDPLGGLDISAEAIVERDLLVVEALRARGIPTMLLPSGGYTDTSHRLIADTVVALARAYG